ncbi:MAG: hypothetical protein HFJ38_06115 [Bacilli bacterium]|nr:hypothetical protein [Bacilli bacterium]
MTNQTKQIVKRPVVPQYIDKKEFLNSLKNTLIYDVLYTQIKEAFPELIPERKVLTEKEIQDIFEHIKKNATRSKICRELNEKINNKYEKVLEKFGDEVDKHNERHGKGVRFKNYSVSIVLKESEQKTKNVQEQELSLIEYTQRNLEKIIARRQKVQNKILCKRLQKI